MSLFKRTYLKQALTLVIILWVKSPCLANDSVEIRVEINEPRAEAIQVFRIQEDQISNSIQDQSLKWEFSHALFNVFSDLTSLASSALILCTQFYSDPIFFHLGAGLSSGITAIEFFRDFHSKVKQIQEHPHDIPSISLITNGVGQVIWGTGLGLLAGGVDSNIGAWVIVSGSLIRFGSTAAQLSVEGMAKTFGNDNQVTNLIFRIGFLGAGITAGSIALASGVSSKDPILTCGGIYSLATAGFLGTVEVLTRDIQDVYQLSEKLKASLITNSYGVE